MIYAAHWAQHTIITSRTATDKTEWAKATTLFWNTECQKTRYTRSILKVPIKHTISALLQKSVTHSVKHTNIAIAKCLDKICVSEITQPQMIARLRVLRRNICILWKKREISGAESPSKNSKITLCRFRYIIRPTIHRRIPLWIRLSQRRETHALTTNTRSPVPAGTGAVDTDQTRKKRTEAQLNASTRPMAMRVHLWCFYKKAPKQ